MLLGPFRVFPGPTQPVLGQLRPFLGASALPGQAKLVLGGGCPIGCNLILLWNSPEPNLLGNNLTAFYDLIRAAFSPEGHYYFSLTHANDQSE
jgi:hypothetical protein